MHAFKILFIPLKASRELSRTTKLFQIESRYDLIFSIFVRLDIVHYKWFSNFFS